MASSWPAAVQLVTVQWGRGLTTLGGDVVGALTLETIFGDGNDYIVWSATGDPWLPFPVAGTEQPGQVGSIQVPAVDQSGWIDPHGNAIKNWHYRATLVYAGAGKPITIVRNFYPVMGSPTIDLDLIADGGDSPPVVTLQQPVRTVNGVGPDANGNVATSATAPTKASVGLGNADNTSDLNKPLSTAAIAALAGKADLVSGLIPTSQIPALALTTVVPVANQTAMLALTTTQVQPGDIAIRADGAGSFILTATNPATLANWTLLSNPAAPVSSVNGQTGPVVLAASDVGAEPTITTLAIAKLPAGSTLTVTKSGSTWPARPTSRADITVQWYGLDPSPAIVSSGTGGMLDGVDIRLVRSV